MKEFVIIRVGSEDRPASPEDITNMTESVRQFAEANDMQDVPMLVTHHAVEVEVFPRRRKSFLKRWIDNML